jgi:hypothetical protein
MTTPGKRIAANGSAAPGKTSSAAIAVISSGERGLLAAEELKLIVCVGLRRSTEFSRVCMGGGSKGRPIYKLICIIKYGI